MIMGEEYQSPKALKWKHRKILTCMYVYRIPSLKKTDQIQTQFRENPCGRIAVFVHRLIEQ